MKVWVFFSQIANFRVYKKYRIQYIISIRIQKQYRDQLTELKTKREEKKRVEYETQVREENNRIAREKQKEQEEERERQKRIQEKCRAEEERKLKEIEEENRANEERKMKYQQMKVKVKEEFEHQRRLNKDENGDCQKERDESKSPCNSPNTPQSQVSAPVDPQENNETTIEEETENRNYEKEACDRLIIQPVRSVPMDVFDEGDNKTTTPAFESDPEKVELDNEKNMLTHILKQTEFESSQSKKPMFISKEVGVGEIDGLISGNSVLLNNTKESLVDKPKVTSIKTLETWDDSQSGEVKISNESKTVEYKETTKQPSENNKDIDCANKFSSSESIPVMPVFTPNENTQITTPLNENSKTVGFDGTFSEAVATVNKQVITQFEEDESGSYHVKDRLLKKSETGGEEKEPIVNDEYMTIPSSCMGLYEAWLETTSYMKRYIKKTSSF